MTLIFIINEIPHPLIHKTDSYNSESFIFLSLNPSTLLLSF